MWNKNYVVIIATRVCVFNAKIRELRTLMAASTFETKRSSQNAYVSLY